MNINFLYTHKLFTLFEGTWTGEGHGEYPTITPFDYRETMVFTRLDASLVYEQGFENAWTRSKRRESWCYVAGCQKGIIWKGNALKT